MFTNYSLTPYKVYSAKRPVRKKKIRLLIFFLPVAVWVKKSCLEEGITVNLKSN